MKYLVVAFGLAGCGSLASKPVNDPEVQLTPPTSVAGSVPITVAIGSYENLCEFRMWPANEPDPRTNWVARDRPLRHGWGAHFNLKAGAYKLAVTDCKGAQQHARATIARDTVIDVTYAEFFKKFDEREHIAVIYPSPDDVAHPEKYGYARHGSQGDVEPGPAAEEEPPAEEPAGDEPRTNCVPTGGAVSRSTPCCHNGQNGVGVGATCA